MQLKPAVETIAEFGEITRQMPAADGMMGTVQGILHVANNRVEPLEHFTVVVLPICRGDNRLMLILVSCDCGETIQAIGDHILQACGIKWLNSIRLGAVDHLKSVLRMKN